MNISRFISNCGAHGDPFSWCKPIVDGLVPEQTASRETKVVADDSVCMIDVNAVLIPLLMSDFGLRLWSATIFLLTGFWQRSIIVELEQIVEKSIEPIGFN